jgi:hypothetical protein
VSVLALALLGWAYPAAAQATKTARGTISAVEGATVTVKVASNDMKFNVDPETNVIAAGAGTKARKAAAAGQAGPKLNELIKAGEAVIVTYREMSGGMMHATQIQVVSSAGPGGGAVSTSGTSTKTTSGVVKSVAAGSLVVTADGKDVTYVVDADTKVIGTGAGTKATAAGGKTTITDLVSTETASASLTAR